MTRTDDLDIHGFPSASGHEFAIRASSDARRSKHTSILQTGAARCSLRPRVSRHRHIVVFVATPFTKSCIRPRDSTSHLGIAQPAAITTRSIDTLAVLFVGVTF